MEDDKPRNNLSYHEALHGVQTGVAYEMEKNLGSTTPKHLRVGINSTFVNDAALVRLLIKKGVITNEEFMEELRLEANRELDRYENRVRIMYGSDAIVLR